MSMTGEVRTVPGQTKVLYSIKNPRNSYVAGCPQCTEHVLVTESVDCPGGVRLVCMGATRPAVRVSVMTQLYVCAHNV